MVKLVLEGIVKSFLMMMLLVVFLVWVAGAGFIVGIIAMFLGVSVGSAAALSVFTGLFVAIITVGTICHVIDNS